MKTMMYWAMQHSSRAVHEFRFRITYWWLSQQVEFLEWRMRREGLMSSMESNPVPTPIRQGGQYAVHSMY